MWIRRSSSNPPNHSAAQAVDPHGRIAEHASKPTDAWSILSRHSDAASAAGNVNAGFEGYYVDLSIINDLLFLLYRNDSCYNSDIANLKRIFLNMIYI